MTKDPSNSLGREKVLVQSRLESSVAAAGTACKEAAAILLQLCGHAHLPLMVGLIVAIAGCFNIPQTPLAD